MTTDAKLLADEIEQWNGRSDAPSPFEDDEIKLIVKALRGELYVQAPVWDKTERRKDNWTLITAENRHRIGQRFKDHRGHEYSFFGIVDGYDDYYYGMYSKEHGMMLLSCVGSIEDPGHGWIEIPSKSLEDEERERYEAAVKRAYISPCGGSKA